MIGAAVTVYCPPERLVVVPGATAETAVFAPVPTSSKVTFPASPAGSPRVVTVTGTEIEAIGSNVYVIVTGPAAGRNIGEAMLGVPTQTSPGVVLGTFHAEIDAVPTAAVLLTIGWPASACIVPEPAAPERVTPQVEPAGSPDSAIVSVSVKFWQPYE